MYHLSAQGVDERMINVHYIIVNIMCVCGVCVCNINNGTLTNGVYPVPSLA